MSQNSVLQSICVFSVLQQSSWGSVSLEPLLWSSAQGRWSVLEPRGLSVCLSVFASNISCYYSLFSNNLIPSSSVWTCPVRSSHGWQPGSTLVWCRSSASPLVSWTSRSKTWWPAATFASLSDWKDWYWPTNNSAGRETQRERWRLKLPFIHSVEPHLHEYIKKYVFFILVKALLWGYM